MSNVVGESETPLFVKSSGNGKTIIRRIVAVILCGVFSMMLFGSAMAHTANTVIGTPKAASDLFLSVVSSPSVAEAIATTVLTDISDRSTVDVQDAINSNRAALEASIVRTIHEPATRALVRYDIARAYRIIETGSGGSIDLKPLVTRFTIDLHAVNPAIPADPTTLADSFIVTIKPGNGVDISNGLSTTAWFLTIAGIVGAILVARFLVRHKFRRLLAVGLTIGLPAIAIASFGQVTGNITDRLSIADATANVLARELINKVGNTLTSTGLFLLAVDVIIVGIWFAIQTMLDRKNPGTPVAEATDVPGLS